MLPACQNEGSFDKCLQYFDHRKQDAYATILITAGKMLTPLCSLNGIAHNFATRAPQIASRDLPHLASHGVAGPAKRPVPGSGTEVATKEIRELYKPLSLPEVISRPAFSTEFGSGVGQRQIKCRLEILPTLIVAGHTVADFKVAGHSVKVAGHSVAERNVAGHSVAERNVAGHSVAGLESITVGLSSFWSTQKLPFFGELKENVVREATFFSVGTCHRTDCVYCGRIAHGCRQSLGYI
jgi:hypothetical protein